MRSIDATARRIRALVMRRGLSANDADEVAQEAFLRLEEARRSEEIAAPEGFVVRVALNLAADIVRRHARWRFEPVPVEDMDLHDPAPTPDDVIGARKRLDRVRAALDALPEEIRTVIVLKRLEGLTIDQIAKREQVGTATVERRLKRGLTLLAEAMGNE